MSVTLETERLSLRPFTAGDAAAVESYVSLWEIARMTSRIPHPYPSGAAAEWIESHRAARNDDQEHTFCITLKEAPGEAVGAAGLRRLEPANWELGYWLAPPYWSRGLATEAAKALVVFGFEKLAAEALQSGHFTDNPASGRVLQKSGFAANGIARQWSEARQDFVDCDRYLLVRATWEQARAETRESAS